jgi:hypothetical protein
MKTKYITYKADVGEDIIVFSLFETHADIAHRLNLEVISAGFIYITTTAPDGDFKAECYGDSVSLKVKSRPAEDAELANRMLGFDNL